MSGDLTIISQNEECASQISNNEGNGNMVDVWNDREVKGFHPTVNAMVALGCYFKGDYDLIKHVAKMVNKTEMPVRIQIKDVLVRLNHPLGSDLAALLMVSEE